MHRKAILRGFCRETQAPFIQNKVAVGQQWQQGAARRSTRIDRDIISSDRSSNRSRFDYNNIVRMRQVMKTGAASAAVAKAAGSDETAAAIEESSRVTTTVSVESAVTAREAAKKRSSNTKRRRIDGNSSGKPGVSANSNGWATCYGHLL